MKIESRGTSDVLFVKSFRVQMHFLRERGEEGGNSSASTVFIEKERDAGRMGK